MEIIDKRTKKEKYWELGDVLEANSSISKGLIVKNNNGNYCLMDITPGEELTYSTIGNECLSCGYETLSDFYEAKHTDWHKVNAKLVIE